jgi:hypothetical protein
MAFAHLAIYVGTTELSTRWLTVNLMMSSPNDALVHTMYIAEKPAHADDRRTQIYASVQSGANGTRTRNPLLAKTRSRAH